MKLNQVIAVMQTVKKKAADSKTKIYHLAQKNELFSGLSRVYTPKDDEGHIYPPESQRVIKSSSDLLVDFAIACQDLFDTAATQDIANTKANADIVVNGNPILKSIPVTHLMFLEKQLIDVKTFISKIPVLAIDKEWIYDQNRTVYVTPEKQTTKTKKIQEFVVAAEATEQHPAQVVAVANDVVEGTWSLVEFSGALSQASIDELNTKVELLIKAVISAREEANSIEVDRQVVAKPIFDFLLGTDTL